MKIKSTKFVLELTQPEVRILESELFSAGFSTASKETRQNLSNYSKEDMISAFPKLLHLRELLAENRNSMDEDDEE